MVDLFKCAWNSRQNTLHYKNIGRNEKKARYKLSTTFLYTHWTSIDTRIAVHCIFIRGRTKIARLMVNLNAFSGEFKLAETKMLIELIKKRTQHNESPGNLPWPWLEFSRLHKVPPEKNRNHIVFFPFWFGAKLVSVGKWKFDFGLFAIYIWIS